MSYRFKQNYYIKETCECGGTRKIKDHGNWVGYYCPSCKQGGSVQKHEKKHFSKHSRGWEPSALTHERIKHIEVDEPQVNMDEFMENDEPMSLYEFCKIESGGLEGQALQNYINRYYGHN